MTIEYTLNCELKFLLSLSMTTQDTENIEIDFESDDKPENVKKNDKDTQDVSTVDSESAQISGE